MQKYGIIKDGDLLLSSRQLDGYKPVVFEQVPENFDQENQYIVQKEPVDHNDHIFVGIEIHDLEVDEEYNE